MQKVLLAVLEKAEVSLESTLQCQVMHKEKRQKVQGSLQGRRCIWVSLLSWPEGTGRKQQK